jgi:hypothetical protein
LVEKAQVDSGGGEVVIVHFCEAMVLGVVAAIFGVAVHRSQL